MSSKLRVLLGIGSLVAIIGCEQQSDEVTVAPDTALTSATFNPAGAPTVEFNLPDMMCEDGCAWTVKDILSKQPGAKDVRVDFEAKIATVAIEDGMFDSQLAIAELVDKGFGNSQLKDDSAAESMPGVPTGNTPAATP